jgi:hypothetical protein
MDVTHLEIILRCTSSRRPAPGASSSPNLLRDASTPGLALATRACDRAMCQQRAVHAPRYPSVFTSVYRLFQSTPLAALAYRVSHHSRLDLLASLPDKALWLLSYHHNPAQGANNFSIAPKDKKSLGCLARGFIVWRRRAQTEPALNSPPAIKSSLLSRPCRKRRHRNRVTSRGGSLCDHLRL